MNREYSKIFENLYKYKAPLIRWDNDDYSGQEVDILVHDNSCITHLVRELFSDGWMLDRRLVNSPHLKMTLFDSMDCIAQLDFVTDLYVFDKSRLFRLIQNTNLNVVDGKYSGHDVKTLAETERYLLILFHSLADKDQVVYKYYDQLAALQDRLSTVKLNSLLRANHIKPSLFRALEKRFFDKEVRKFDRLKLFLSLGAKQPRNLLKGLLIRGKRWKKRKIAGLFGCKFVVFMGADGSGKTTTIHALMNTLGRSNCQYLHLGNQSQILPTTRLIAKYRKRNESRNSNGSVEVKKKKETYSLRLFKELLYNINVHMEVYVHISWSLVRNILARRKFLLVDRYIYDRWMMGTSINKFRFFPQPDLIVLLDAPTDILLKRKAEHARVIVEEFKSTYLEFCCRQNFARVVRINTDNIIESSVNQIKLILDEIS